MGPQHDLLILSTFGFQGRFILRACIPGIVHDGGTVFIAMNEHWDGEGQSSGEHHGCTQLRG